MIDDSRSKAFSGLWILAMVLFAALLFTACDEDSAQDDDDDAQDDDGDDDLGSDWSEHYSECPNSYCITELDMPGADWDCDNPDNCYWDYIEFIGLAGEYAEPISPQLLEQQIAAILNGDVQEVEDDLNESKLRQVLHDTLNIEFLLKKINQRPLTVVHTEDIDYPSYIEKRLLFADPYVGLFKAALLVPKGEGPFPAILARHGHGDDEQVFLDSYGGRTLAEHGYVVLSLVSRAMGVNDAEDLITRSLLINGFTFMGLRSYESLLGLKYLEFLDSVDEKNIGLIGHSGGSISNNLTVRIEPKFAAYVSDCQGEYFSIQMETGYLIDETVPLLYPYRKQLNDFYKLSTPTLQVDYGYEGEMDRIVEFFDGQLSD